MQFEDIIMDYDFELEELYKVKADPRMFDSDKLSHGYTCSCRSQSLDVIDRWRH